MNKLLIVCCIFLFNSCMMLGEKTSNYIVGTNYGSKDWEIVNSEHYTAVIAGVEKKYREIAVDAGLRSATYVKSIAFIPLPFLYSADCTDRSGKTVYIYIYRYPRDGKLENSYTFDVSKMYIIKDGKKYYLKPQHDYAPISDINMITAQTTHAHFAYQTPFICGEFENAVFVVDGISVNGQPLEPLMIQLNYIDPTKVPLYNGNE